MRAILPATMMAVGLSGCFVDVMSTAAITSTLQAEQASHVARHIQQAQEATGSLSAQGAVDVYWAEKGVYPPSLEALVPEYLPAVPTLPNGEPYAYDPYTGRVSEQPIGPPMSPAEREKLDRLQAAIDVYAGDYRVYPATLDVLVPVYIDQLLYTDSYTPFQYDPMTGRVAMPGAPMPPPAHVAGQQQPHRSQTPQPIQGQAQPRRHTQGVAGRPNVGAGRNSQIDDAMDNLGL